MVLSTRELRIGNIVLDEYLEEVYIIAIFKERLKVSYSGDDDESVKYLDISEINPLLITPELLEKAGFEKRGIYYHFLKNNIIRLEYFETKKHYVISYFYFLLYHTSVKYFHHLQNLIFDLTGEEITI